MQITYKRETQKILDPAKGKIARATNNLSFKLSLKNLRNKSDLFIREGNLAQVAEWSLLQVVEKAEKKLLRVTLLAELEGSTPDMLEK